ncbi:MAG: fibronectin type III domain-containing protein [Candidatus Aquicultorales bacterium]
MAAGLLALVPMRTLAGDETTSRLSSESNVKAARAAEAPDGWYLGDAHLHTDFSDGFHDVRTRAEQAAANGLDWLIITDHSYGIHASSPKIYKDALAKAQAASGILIGAGTEVFSKVQGDALELWLGDKYPPLDKTYGHEQLIDEITANNYPDSMAIIAHPHLEGPLWPVDIPVKTAGIEISYGPTGIDWEAIAHWRAFNLKHLQSIISGQRGPLVMLGDSDAHRNVLPGTHATWTYAPDFVRPNAYAKHPELVYREPLAKALRSGRVSVSDGMYGNNFGTMELNGLPLGSIVRATPGEPMALKLSARHVGGLHLERATVFDSQGKQVFSVQDPAAGDISASLPAPSSPGFYYAAFSFATGGHAVVSQAVTNAVFVAPKGVDTAPPASPAGLRVVQSEGRLSLSWAASGDDQGVAGYAEERSIDESTWAQVGTSPVPGCSDSPSIADSPLYYRVRAYDYEGKFSEPSNVASGMIDGTPPQAPADLIAVRISESSVALSWSRSTDNRGVTSYEAQRSLDQNEWHTLPEKAAVTELADRGLSPDTKYYFRVRAFDEAGNGSAFSNTVSATTKKVAVNDVNGDQRSDVLALYKYGRGWGGWAFRSVGSGNPASLTFVPTLWWRDPSFDLSNSLAISGDFDGDNDDEIAFLKRVSSTASTLWMLDSNTASFLSPRSVFHSPAWDWSRTKLVAGDFTGSGNDQIVAFYNYGGHKTGVFVFERNPDGSFSYPRRVYYTEGWDTPRTRLLAIKDGAKAKVIAAYDYGGTTTGLWAFELDYRGLFDPPTPALLSNQWIASRTSFSTGDVDGDGLTDIMAAYNYGSGHTGVFVFKATGKGDKVFAYPSFVYHSTQWIYEKSTFIPGDFNGDGKADLGAVYDYGSDTTGIWVFTSNGTKLNAPHRVYLTKAWNNLATKWVAPYQIVK